MGGYGSGRPGSGRLTTDPLHALDIRVLRKRGYFRVDLEPGTVAVMPVEWTCRGEPSGAITVRVPYSPRPYPPFITLDYAMRVRGATEATPVNERVAIETTPCHYGGERPWFLCPRCGDRRGVLFSVRGYFRCRACHQLDYSSTRESASDRVFRRGQAIKRKLGGHKTGTVFDWEPKPKGMHWSTYARICDELRECEGESWEHYQRLFGPIEQRLAKLEALSPDRARE